MSASADPFATVRCSFDTLIAALRGAAADFNRGDVDGESFAPSFLILSSSRWLIVSHQLLSVDPR